MVSQIALFDPAGELTLPKIGRWVMAGGKLTSIGHHRRRIDQSRSSRPAPSYQQDILDAAGVPITQEGQSRDEAKLAEMFMIKAWQFIIMDGKENQAEADQFSQR